MENKLYVSPSPHIHGGDSISKNMYGVLMFRLSWYHSTFSDWVR